MTDASEVLQPWWDRYPGIFLVEMAVARKRSFRPRFGQWVNDGLQDAERLIVRGRIRVHAARPGETPRWHGMTIDVAYPPVYPFDKLDVRPLDEGIRRRRHQLGETGELCYMQEELEGWALGYGIDRAIAGAEQWLHGEITGRFDDEVPAAELLSYIDDRAGYVRALLLPKHILWERAPDQHGLLDVEWDGQEQGIAIVGMPRTKAKAPLADIRRTNDRIWRSVRGPQRFKSIPGLWFSLDGEPQPFSDIRGLEETLARHAGVSLERFQNLVAKVADRSVRCAGWLPIGLNYPARSQQGNAAEREWLFCMLEWPTLPERFVKARRLRPMFWNHLTIKGIRSYPVRSLDLVRRRGQLYSHEGIETARVVVVGTGALGSTVARSLTAAGVDRVTIVDPDLAKPGNVMRHEARMPDVGKSKIATMRQILYETNPYVDVDIIASTRSDSPDFEQAIFDADDPPTLIIATVAVRAVDGQVDELARRANPPIPVLHAWVMAQAQMLRAFVYRPGHTACFWCTGLHDRDRRAGIENGYIIEPATQSEPFFEASCTSPAFAGAGNANALAAHVIVEMALDVLHNRLLDEQSHWIFAGNRIHAIDPTFPVALLSTARAGFAPHTECPVCADNVLRNTLSEKEQEVYQRELLRVRNGT